MKTLVRIIIIITVALLLAVWSPWNSWNIDLPRLLGYGNPQQYAGLQVKSLAGELKIYLDDRELGITRAEGEVFESADIAPGPHQVRLVRESNPSGFYQELTRVINFEPDVDVVISYDLGPTVDFSEGHILAARAKKVSSAVELKLKTTPATAQVSIDGIALTDRILPDLDLGRQHTVKVSAPGYETLEFVILPDSQSDRDKLKGFDLNLDITLTLIPLELSSK